MGTFNFSNMKKEETYVPREFRAAVENAKQQPIGSGTEKTGFWDGIKNFFSGGDVDTSNGFIDETGSWNNGTDQEMAKFTQPQYQTKEKAWNNSLAGQIVNSNAYKKYFYSKDDVLLEAKKISAATSIPENAILSSSDNLASAREIYNYQQRAMDPQKVFEAYPELSTLAQKSDTDAAIALHNLKNVRQTQGIIEAAKTGWELDNLMSERGRLGYQAMNGRTLTDDDLKRLAEIAKQQKAAKELPSILEDPLGAIVGGTVQSGKMMVRNALNGQKMGIYGAGFGAVLGGVIGGGTTLGTGTAPGAIAGAQMGYAWGSRIGIAQDMYSEVAGNNYLDYKNYKDKNGRQLLTDNQARLYAAAAAGVETAIEFSNADKILNIIKGGAGAQSLKNIISSATNSTELQSMLAQYVKNGMKNVGGVAISESAEEGAQEMSNRIISNVMAANNPGGDIPTYSVKDILAGGLEASWQALPASIGFGLGAHAGSTVSFMRRAAAVLQIKNEEQQANMQTANGISMLKNLAEDIKNNELFKKSPEVYREVLNNQLQGTDLETVNIDTEYVLHQEGGYELLKETADKIGISEEQFKDIVEIKADLKINTADYVEKCLPNDIGGRLEDYITFSDIGECLARNREYAARMKREMDRVLAFEERQREDALNTFLDKNFPNPENREVAEAVLRRFPDNPKEGVKEIRKSLQAKIDEPLNEIIAELEAGMGNGVSIVETEEFDGQLRGRGVRVSNNAPWYQKYYKENKKAPSKRELRDIAYDIYTGKNEYGLLGWENNSAEEDQWYQNNKASIEATEEAIRRLDALTPMLEKIDPGELSITEGLSEEGFEVYRKLRGQLEGAESKQVRQAAQMSAIIAARMADRMAELHRQAGQKKYTALDYARSIGLVRDGEVGGGLRQSAMRQENKRYVLNSDGNIDWGVINELTADDGTQIKKAPIRMQIGYQVDERKAGAGYIHIMQRHDEFLKAKGYTDVSAAVSDILNNADFMTKETTTDGRDRLAVIKDLSPHTSLLMALDYTEDNREKYYTIVSIMPQSKKQTAELKKKALSFDGSGTPSTATGSGTLHTPTETKAGIKGDSFAGKDNTFTVSLADADKYVNTYTYKSDNLNQEANVVYPSNGVPFVSNKSYRCTDGDAISSYTGYAMFADYAPATDMYGDNLYTVNHADLTDINEIKPKIEAAWDEAVEKGTIPPELESLADERSGKEIAEDFDPQDIVDGAGAWDVPELVSWAFNAGVFDDISGVKTKDGAVAWDESLISQGDKDAEVWGMDEESYDQKAWHGTPYNFERFDIGKIGAGVGDQVHGWGLYFAKNKKVSDNYKKVLSEGGNTEASLFKVEVPDNKYLLDEQKPFYEQPKDVQKHTVEAIESLNNEQQKRFWSRILKFKLDAINKSHSVETRINHLDTIANHSLESLAKADLPRFRKNISRRNLSNHGYTEEQIARLETDEEYRQQEKEKMLTEIQELNVELEKAKAEDNAAKAKVIEQAQDNTAEELGDYSNRYRFTGEKMYDALAYALGEKEPDWRGASATLNAHDVKGITYDGMRDGRCFVVFDDKAVDIIERYNQAAGKYAIQQGLWQLKGQTAFKATGEKLISLFKTADQSTFLHEMAHVYYHDMLELAKLPNAPKQLLDDVATIEKWAKWDEQQFDKEYKGTALEREFKKLNEQMKEASQKGFVEIDGRKMNFEQMQKLWMQERFARGFENYLKEGKAPTESVRSVFRRFKQWLTQIYRAFSQIGGAPSKEVKAVMDRMVASEDEIDIAMKKKGVDDFAKDGGMNYLADSSKQVYNRMVERAKADAEEKVLRIALKDVKEEHAKQESEFFAREEADYREKLAAEPVFIIQEHLKNNPSLSTSAVCETLGMSVEDYAAKLKEYGGSLDAAVKSHMKEVKKSVDNSGLDAQYFREKAEEVVQESRYRKLAAAMELNAFEAIAKKQRNITVKAKKEEQNTDDEKGVIKTVDKITKQNKKIEELTGENKQLKSDKRNLLTNVRGLRDAAVKHYQEYVQYVEMKLEVMPLKDANNYQMWRRKSAQAQYSSEQSLIKGEWDKAVRYKQAQLIYEMFADRAVRNAKQVKKIEDGLKRKQQTITKNKNISADERYAFNHLMYVFGFSDNDAPQPPKYEGIMEVLMKADAAREEGGLMLESPFFTPDGQTNLPEWFFKAAMDVQKRKEGHSDLSNMQLELLAQVMHIIYKRGMDNMNLHTIKTRDGKMITVDEAIAEIEGQVRQRMVERINADPTGANDSTKLEQAENFVDAADKALIKPEVELKKMGDVAVRYIYDPLKEAADKELKMSVDMQSRLKNLFSEYTEQELRDMRTKQLYKFGSSTLTKEQAIMLALNCGTEINQKRVMDGYRVNIAQVKSVLANLTEKDWRLVDAVWKLYDRHWDDVKEIEARMSGAVLQKQEAKGFVIIGTDKKIYTIDGGYFPIKYDPRDIRTQEQKADAAVQQSAMSNIAMSLGKGFLKDRSNAKIERRLDLHFEVISDSLTDVIHLVAFREPVRDVRRIVLNDNFKNLVYRYLGQNTYKNLKKWTADCWAEEPIPKTAYEKAMAKMRNAQTMGTMGFRATTALLNLANLPSVAHYMGAAEMLHALKKFYSAPREYADFIFQRSVFMAERSETMDASIRDAIKGPSFLDSVPGVGKAGDVIKDNAFKMITWTDLMLALPLWQHEYEKAYNAEFEAGRSAEMSRQAGVAAGDAAVRWCFGSGRTVDKAAIQRGGELVKQLTMYYSYNSTVYNALNYKIWEAKVGYKKAVAAAAKDKNLALMKAVAHAGDALLMWILLPAVISALLRAGASGDNDDWKIDKLLKATGKESLTGLVGGIPILRDAIPFLMAKVFDEKQYAPKIPIQNTIDQTNRVIQSIVNDKKTIADTLREMGKLTSQLTGAPSTLIDGFATTLQYIESGFEEDIATYLRALIFDKNLKKK